ncbi:hypothetical protein CYLTODRAFT_365239 [Cylindrobasidium torrendii FP15055 ss-10]|uniref:Zn(2)-C6 fungal-type domain-containing protein n=1 Tax=Cylindrobasidium torrendii FP15055 ss-10 TaxID=1314674 RepID=A0A0D7BT76_9AGAR|nr:hypothetical protein CYLTODRAFT_365239 [Cylindrobasidium torrendii FP15055 ss-10]
MSDSSGVTPAAVPTPGSKKRRLQGACDLCRQKKVKCDSAAMPNNRCSNCIAFQSECTHVAALSKKPGRWHQGHISEAPIAPIVDLQSHISAILTTAPPYVVPKDQAIVRAVMVDMARYIRELEAEVHTLKEKTTARTEPKTDEENDLDEHSIHLEKSMNRLAVCDGPSRHYGKSSLLLLIVTAQDIKHNMFRTPDSVIEKGRFRRTAFWTSSPLQRTLRDADPPLLFPPEDLIHSLVEIYLNTINLYLCIHHAPSFRRDVRAKKYHTSRSFGHIVLVVCALAARQSPDPRVGHGHDTGWQWFRQIRVARPSESHRPADLYQMQLYPLMCVFQFGGATPEPAWTLAGQGIKLAQDVGAHRRRPFDPETWHVEDEMLKRTFWAMVIIDILTSAITGRPRATTAEHYDLDLPLVVDDEYWPGEALSDPTHPWVQPRSTEPRILGHVLHLKLLEILGIAQNLVYSLRRPSVWDMLGAPKWGQNVAVVLDSELNKWMDSLPPRFRWSESNPDLTAFDQSMILYSTYFLVQMQIHRPFMPAIRRGDENKCSMASVSAGFPSIIICGAASRFCTHLLHGHSRRSGLILPHMSIVLLHSGIHILLNMWAGSKLGLTYSLQEQAKDIETCLSLFSLYEKKFQIAGRYSDMLRELYRVGVPPQYLFAPDVHAQKRRLEQDVSSETGIRPAPEPPTQGLEELMGSYSSMDHQWHLPIHTDDFLLGWTPPPEFQNSDENDPSLANLLSALSDGNSDDAMWYNTFGVTVDPDNAVSRSSS